jgi:hypothetical protein
MIPTTTRQRRLRTMIRTILRDLFIIAAIQIPFILFLEPRTMIRTIIQLFISIMLTIGTMIVTMMVYEWKKTFGKIDEDQYYMLAIAYGLTLLSWVALLL